MGDQPDIMQRLRSELACALHEYAVSAPSGPWPPYFRRWKSIIDLYDIVKGNRPRTIGVYGTPKMGKSTLINSLVQEQILPKGIKPVTGSVINLTRRKEAEEYTVASYRADEDGKNTLYQVFKHPKVEKVYEYLERVACRNDPADQVEVSGDFPNSLFEDHYRLRDTPGAITTEAVNSTLNRDSQRALAALEDVCLPIYCVCSETMQGKDHVNYYKKCFSDRLCLCVITKCDDYSEDERLELINTFRSDYGVQDADVPIICTGKDKIEDPFLSKDSLGELKKAIQSILSEKTVERLLRSSCDSLLEQANSRSGLGWRVHECTKESIDEILRKLKGNNNRP